MKFHTVALLLAASLAFAHRVESKGVYTISLKGQTVDGVEGPYKMPGERYIASLDFGHDASQKLKIQFDSSHNGAFVPLKKSQNGNLHFQDGFNPWQSLVVREDSCEYKNSSLSGKLVSDKIAFGGEQKELTLKSLFLAAEESSRDFTKEAWDGVIGLGPRNFSETGVKNIITALKEQGIIKKAQFGLWFSPPVMKEQKFEIILGDLDVKRAADMSIISGYFHNKDQWRVHLSSAWINEKPIGCQFQNCKAYFNTGSSATYGPRDQVYQLYAELGINGNTTSNTYVDCDTVPRNVELKFVFESRQRVLPSAYFIKESYNKETSERTCYVTIYPHEHTQLWSMGTNFMSAYYTAYDVEKELLLIAH